MNRALEVAAVFTLVGIIAASGCKKVTQGAKEHFSRDFTCPLERVEVRPRKDLRPSDFEAHAKPSKEIAADPDRLAMWQAEQNKNREWMDKHDEILEARGCDHEALYACHRHNKDASYIMCSQKKLPDAPE